MQLLRAHRDTDFDNIVSTYPRYARSNPKCCHRQKLQFFPAPGPIDLGDIDIMQLFPKRNQHNQYIFVTTDQHSKQNRAILTFKKTATQIANIPSINGTSISASRCTSSLTVVLNFSATLCYNVRPLMMLNSLQEKRFIRRDTDFRKDSLRSSSCALGISLQNIKRTRIHVPNHLRTRKTRKSTDRRTKHCAALFLVDTN